MWTAAVARRWARPLLLAATLVGLTAMHTLGHEAHAPVGDHHGHRPGAHAAVVPAAVGDLAYPAMASGAAGGAYPATAPGAAGRAHPATDDRALWAATGPGGTRVGNPASASPAGGGDGDGGGLSGWGVCLAVLGTLAVPLLLAVLVTARRPSGAVSAGRRGRSGPAPRAPPTPVGLRIATVSVLRR